MFKLPSKEETFPTPCEIETPVGEVDEKRTIVIHFRVIPTTRWDELARQSAFDLLVEIIGDWEDVYAADGKTPLPCDEEHIRLAADIPYFFRGAVLGYSDRFSALKNFRAPLAH